MLGHVRAPRADCPSLGSVDEHGQLISGSKMWVTWLCAPPEHSRLTDTPGSDREPTCKLGVSLNLTLDSTLNQLNWSLIDAEAGVRLGFRRISLAATQRTDVASQWGISDWKPKYRCSNKCGCELRLVPESVKPRRSVFVAICEVVGYEKSTTRRLCWHD